MDISLVIANDWLIVFNANVNVDVWNLPIKDHLKDFAQLTFVIDAIETSLINNMHLNLMSDFNTNIDCDCYFTSHGKYLAVSVYTSINGTRLWVHTLDYM